ncbi:MAG: winged helix-turn-helix domain-containing protein [Wenzhouxiangella sp.]|jgi:DNA-binding winged helix-turn-helix (wHTH) protein/TolB-like protein|nr:winged helix-turn-helix domain-containing protein [Wenzhouxiangella sp.]
MPVYGFGPFDFEPQEGRLEHRDTGQQTTLRPQVARLLQALLDRPQQVIDRDALCRAVWDEGAVVDFEAGLAAVLRELRSELRALGGSDAWVETVPRRGIRLSGEVTVADRVLARPRRRRSAIAFGVAAALILAMLLLLAWQQMRPSVTTQTSSSTLAVLPFSQFGAPESGSPRLDLLLADMLLVELWEKRPPDLTLIGRASLTPYAGRDNVAAMVAEDLGVNLLIEGSVVFGDGATEVSARLLAMPDGHILWSETRRYDTGQTPSAREIARVLADSLLLAWPASLP